MTRTIFTGAAVFDGAQLLPRAALVVEDGRVAALLPEAEAPGATRVRLEGGVLAPGFLDLQVNGGGGAMLGEAADPAAIEAICRIHIGLGATGILPTLITDRPEVTRAVIEAGIAAAEARVPGFLGLHLEGPHLDPRRKGAHDPGLIRPMEAADLALYAEAAARLPVLVITLAPEAATPEQIAALTRAGVRVSLGHSDAGMAAARAAFAAGAGMVTHLFNAMSPLGHREPGLVGAALDADVRAGLIADGVHVAREVIRIALAAKRGAGRVFLVSDAMAVAGTDLPEFRLGGRRILRAAGRLTLEDGTLAGADIDLPASVRVLVDEVGIAPDVALGMASAAPADAIGDAERGRLQPGMRADLVHLTDALALDGVWLEGLPV